MQSKIIKAQRRFLVAVGLVFILTSPPSSQCDQSARAKFFLSLSGHSLSYTGDLNRGLVLWHFEKAFFVPKMENGFGFGLGFGYKRESSLWDFVILRSSHKAYLEGLESTAIFHSAEVNGRALLFKNRYFQPYFLLGIGLPWINAKKGAQMHHSIYNTTYTGFEINLGAGLIVHLAPKWFISGGIVYRILRFLYVSGDGKGRDLNDLRLGQDGPKLGRLLEASGVGLSFSLCFSL
jgi:hypothetical protein